MPASNLSKPSSPTVTKHQSEAILFTDFDGTITGQAGNATVYTEFYQSLLKGYVKGKKQDYKSTPMKSKEDVADLFVDKFGPYDPEKDYKDTKFLMGSDEIRFFKAMLCNPYITVHVITKNRREYIEAVFRYQGFSRNEINRLHIVDRGSKDHAVEQGLSAPLKAGQLIYILDDDKDDHDLMAGAAKQKNTQGVAQIKTSNEKPGTFAWADYLKEIKKHLPSAPITYGLFETYIEKPGCLYLRFADSRDMAAAIKSIEDLGITKVSGDSLKEHRDKAAYRASKQKLTIEITIEAKNKIEQARKQVELLHASQQAIDKAIASFKGTIDDYAQGEKNSIPTAYKVLTILEDANTQLQQQSHDPKLYTEAAKQFKSDCELAVREIKENGLDKEPWVGDWLNNVLSEILNALNHIISIPKKIWDRDISSTFFARRDYTSTEIREAFLGVSTIPELIEGSIKTVGNQP